MNLQSKSYAITPQKKKEKGLTNHSNPYFLLPRGLGSGERPQSLKKPLKRNNVKMCLLGLFISQPLAFTFDVNLEINNHVLKVVGAWVVSIITTLIVAKYSNKK
ncbi:MAG: hypothetical protein ACK5B9_00795 [Flavobacteriia bacterium]|jgi:hypothetical protein